MRVLLLAPQPFYQGRGTPIAVALLARSLVKAGHEVDLLTFGEGQEYDLKGAEHYRLRNWFGLRDIRPGPSFKKLVLDVFFFFKLIGMLWNKNYQVVHAVEESAFMAMCVCPIFGVKYVYDMDSHMTTQIIDKVPAISVLEGVLGFFESLPMRFASAVVPVCDALGDIVARYRSEGVFILKDVSLVEGDPDGSIDVIDVRAKLGKDSSIIMYIGNLETYQGIELMLEAFAQVIKDQKEARLAIIGGEPEHIEFYRQFAERLNIGEAVCFFGKQPVELLNAYMKQATILVSPRTQGVNTPMKIYSYLDSMVPVLATNLPTHTQVMTEDFSVLVSATPADMAKELIALLGDPSRCEELAKKAREFIKQEHSIEVFEKKLTEIYAYLED